MIMLCYVVGFCSRVETLHSASWRSTGNPNGSSFIVECTLNGQLTGVQRLHFPPIYISIPILDKLRSAPLVTRESKAAFLCSLPLFPDFLPRHEMKSINIQALTNAPVQIKSERRKREKNIIIIIITGQDRKETKDRSGIQRRKREQRTFFFRRRKSSLNFYRLADAI